MSGKAVGRAAVDLPWLCPNTSSLVGLTEAPAVLPSLAAADPALFVFLCRFALGEADSPFFAPNDRLASASLPELAAAYLRASQCGWLDPHSPAASTIRQITDFAAVMARRLADATQRVFPEAVETAARLAPLGWMAVAACDDAEASACASDPSFSSSPVECQRTRWGLDHAGIARRLAARWKLPPWLNAIVGCLNLPFEAAVHLGADPDLFAIVSLAVHAAERRNTNLGLAAGIDSQPILSHLGLSSDDVDSLASPDFSAACHDGATDLDPNPHRVPLLKNLLAQAGQARRRNGTALVARLEERIDELHESAASLASLAGNRLRDSKLAALAELAAGAGHEINNPLAVISGNAQRLLRTEQDDDRSGALRAIIRQSQRISDILRELMQFARPPRPEQSLVPLVELLDAVRSDLLPLAEERKVRLEAFEAAPELWARGDAKQLRQAIGSVARNAIEAAGAEGWVRISLSTSGGTARVVVEDSGPGLTREAAEHAFDPFYSGRSAGRGRGLGLATAWQLTRANGGELEHDAREEGPTRFVISLPLADPGIGLERRSA